VPDTEIVPALANEVPVDKLPVSAKLPIRFELAAVPDRFNVPAPIETLSACAVELALAKVPPKVMLLAVVVSVTGVLIVEFPV
jgi:hypothetical protein